METVKMLYTMLTCKAIAFMHDEEGDTNFISVLMLLGIALALAVVFFGFRNQIVDFVNDNLKEFFTAAEA